MSEQDEPEDLGTSASASEAVTVVDLGSSSDSDPQPTFQKYDFKKDQGLHTGTMWFLGLTVLLCLFGAITLSFSTKEIPDLLSVIGGAAVAALATLFKPK